MFDFFFNPKTIAVIGASRQPGKVGYDTLKEVGKQFGIKKGSSVSSIVERMKSGIKVDRELNKRIRNLIESIAKSQEPT